MVRIASLFALCVFLAIHLVKVKGFFNNLLRTTSSRHALCRSRSEMRMVFDFLRDRSEEGFKQLENLAKKTGEGKLIEALRDTGDYIALRQKADAENLKRLTDGLSMSRERLLSGIGGAFSDKDASLDIILGKLEDVLLQADIGSATTSEILKDLKAYAVDNKLKQDDILPVLRERLVEALTPPDNMKSLRFSNTTGEPTIMFVIGANGMGKTTTIGKLSSRLKNDYNMSVLLGACDTFRAAAVEQLGEWALRANVSIEVPTEDERGGDPVPVVTRSIRRAKEEGFDVCIIDTSGRLSNNFELTQQLQDMKAAIVAENIEAPHETLLVVDGSMGRNAVEQAGAWRKYVGVSGLAITKLDGTARGGFVVSVVRDLGLPVKFIGVGEKIEDLREFDPATFVDALLGNDPAKTKMLQERARTMMGLRTEEVDDSDVQVDVDSLSNLRASFNNNNNNGKQNDSFGVSGSLGIGVPSSIPDANNKRKKRPKPQNSKKKKK